MKITLTHFKHVYRIAKNIFEVKIIQNQWKWIKLLWIKFERGFSFKNANRFYSKFRFDKLAVWIWHRCKTKSPYTDLFVAVSQFTKIIQMFKKQNSQNIVSILFASNLKSYRYALSRFKKKTKDKAISNRVKSDGCIW